MNPEILQRPEPWVHEFFSTLTKMAIAIRSTVGAQTAAIFPTKGLGRQAQKNLVLHQWCDIDFFSLIKLGLQVLATQLQFLHKSRVGLGFQAGRIFRSQSQREKLQTPSAHPIDLDLTATVDQHDAPRPRKARPDMDGAAETKVSSGFIAQATLEPAFVFHILFFSSLWGDLFNPKFQGF